MLRHFSKKLQKKVKSLRSENSKIIKTVLFFFFLFFIAAMEEMFSGFSELYEFNMRRYHNIVEKNIKKKNEKIK